MATTMLRGISNALASFSTFTFAAAAFMIAIATVLYLKNDANDPKEPPLAPTRIPFIGHLIGIIRYQNQYFDILQKQNLGPISTLKIFSRRIYMITSPELTAAAFRQTKEIDFETIKQTVSCCVVDFDKRATDIVCLPPKKGESSYMLDLHQEMYGALAQGHALQVMNTRVLNCLARYVNEVGTKQQPKKLWSWMQHFYAVASAEALYGIDNPITRDHCLIQCIWDFEKDLAMLSLGTYPSIIARKGYLARKKCRPEFFKYYAEGLDKNASGFVQGRARCARKWGLTTMDMAQAEISILFASVTNTLPNVFYMLYYILSIPSLVPLVREEVGKIATRKEVDAVDTISLDISRLPTDCPLLTSCFSETLRLVKTGASVRTILADVMLNDQYLLKKDSIVQIPGGIMQSDPRIWGPDAAVFNPRRFLAEEKEKLGKGAKKAQNQGYIPFGGGKNLCPGRHLAYNEITSFVALVLYGFEITEMDGGVVKGPEGCFQMMGEGSRAPKSDPEVLISRRQDFEGVLFRFDVPDRVAVL